MICNVKIEYSYDGSKFKGFQKQPKYTTVQGTIEEILSNMFEEDIKLISSGRTDSGVHAEMQVSNFTTSKIFPLDRIKYVINRDLKLGICINNIEYVNVDFNSRYSVKKRTYKYRLSTIKNMTVFDTNYVSIIKNEIDIKKINEIAKQFKGTYDFSSFCKKNETITNYVRTIYSIKFKKVGNQYEMYICGNAFLHSMVRIITATLIAVHDGVLKADYISNMLENPVINKPKKIMTPNGLYLYKVEY